jgi:hypothetical protein
MGKAARGMATSRGGLVPNVSLQQERIRGCCERWPSPRRAAFMILLNVSISNVALPAIELGWRFPRRPQWVVSGCAGPRSERPRGQYAPPPNCPSTWSKINKRPDNALAPLSGLMRRNRHGGWTLDGRLRTSQRGLPYSAPSLRQRTAVETARRVYLVREESGLYAGLASHNPFHL